MTLITDIQNDISAVVAKAAALEAGIVNAVALVEADIQAFFQWLAAETPAIIAAVQQAENVVKAVQAVGVVLPPSVQTDLSVLNAAVAALNAAANDTNSGAATSKTLVDAYTAAQQAYASAAQISTVAVAPQTSAAPTPSA